MIDIPAFLPLGSEIDAVAALAALSAFVSVVVLWQALRLNDPLAQRARSIVLREQELRRTVTSTARRTNRRPRSKRWMSRIVSRLNLLQGNHVHRIRTHLALAGLRSRESLVTYLFFKITLPITFGLAAVFLFEILNFYQLPAFGRTLAAIGAVLVGAYSPEIWVRNRIAKRRHAMTRAMPDALDLLVICVEAGLSLDAALKRTAGELARSAPELADELELASVELGFLPDRSQALRNLAARTGIKPVAAMVGALLQTEKFGTPVAQSLRVLAAEFRNERLMHAEEKAARLPATLTVPMVVFILPTLFIVLIGPAILKTIDSLQGL